MINAFKKFKDGIKKPQFKRELKRGKICFYDTETTSIHPKCGGRICEFAGLLVEKGIPKKAIHVYLNPETNSWYGAFKAHGLSDAFLRTQTPFFKVSDKIKSFIDEANVRCAHNGKQFDDNYLNFEFKRADLVHKFKEIINSTSVSPIPIKKAHAKLIKHKLYNPKKKDLVNDDQEASYLAGAAVMYFYRDYLKQETINKKPGPLMFLNGILPNQNTHPMHYEAAVIRLAYFKLIRIDTTTEEQRKKLKLPLSKPIRDAISRAERYIAYVVDLFENKILNEDDFNQNKINLDNMFDTYAFARENDDVFARNVNIDNLKLDGLMDYYHINRFERETGNHNAGIDTLLLFEVVKKMFSIKKSTFKVEFKKNAILEFDKKGKVIKEEALTLSQK